MIRLKELIEPDNYWGSVQQKYFHPGENPTVDTIAYCEDKVLLIKRQGDTANEQWAIPGGFVDTTAKKGEPFKMDVESFKEAAMREFREEAGIDITPIKFRMKELGKFSGSGRDPRDNDKAWSATTVFMVDFPPKWSDKINAGDDASDVRWFTKPEVDKLNMAFDHKKHVLTVFHKMFSTFRDNY